MMVGKISGSPPVEQSAQKVDGDGSVSFNKVLSDKTAALVKDESIKNARVKTSPEASFQGLSTSKLVKIGTITSKIPTVSNLLIKNPILKKDCWNIIYAQQNRDKPYTRISTGTDIYYNPETKELLWGDMLEKFTNESVIAATPTASGELKNEAAPHPMNSESVSQNQVSAESEVKDDGLNASLVEAIQPLIGRSYSNMNCYELLVNGLSKIGVRYFGRDGLGRQMMAGAVGRGLPMNAYLNGEGLIRFSGSEMYRKSFLKVSDPADQARQVIEEMAAYLEKGCILSFSTESRGHAGIISNKGGTWTYINSGVMDHPVGIVTTEKGVGEENLNKEIEDWFQLAAERNESLVITMGKLNQNKLAAYGTGRELSVS